MTTIAHDTPVAAVRVGGLGFAVLSAASFGLSGSLASGLMDAGWSAGAAVAARICLASLVLLAPALVTLRGRWSMVRRNAGIIAAYGVIAVAGCQLAYFNAVDHLPVAVALLVEYTAPVAVIGWLWLRRGQKPGRLTLAGAALAGVGLLFVLDVLSGGAVSVVGLLWAFVAMGGAAFYFVVSADDRGLPPIVLAAGGLTLGSVVLLLAGWVGVVPFRASSAPVSYGDVTVPVWLPLLALGVVTAAIAYVSGIAAVRRLGSRLASFVALAEVLFAVVFAWLLLGQLPGPLQFFGAALVVAGVVVVKLGEMRLAASAGPVV